MKHLASMGLAAFFHAPRLLSVGMAGTVDAFRLSSDRVNPVLVCKEGYDTPDGLEFCLAARRASSTVFNAGARGHESIMMKPLLILCFSTAALAQQWVAYSAGYTETVKNTDSSGHITLNQTKAGEEIRSSDGSLLTTVIVNGKRMTARLWQACGQMIDINYAQKRATLLASAARRHPNQPPDSPQGTITIGGMEFVAYPVHSNV
jgi:hypothetical protein